MYFGYQHIKIQVKCHLILVLHVVSQSSYTTSRQHKLNIVLKNQASNWKYYIINLEVLSQKYSTVQTAFYLISTLDFYSSHIGEIHFVDVFSFLSTVCVEANFHQAAHLGARQAGQTVPSLRWYHLPARNRRAKQHQSQ